MPVGCDAGSFKCILYNIRHGRELKIGADEGLTLYNPEVDMGAMCAGRKVIWGCVVRKIYADGSKRK